MPNHVHGILAIRQIIALEKIWRCRLRSSSFVAIAVEPDAVYAGASGELFCIDPTTGEIRWHNKLKGLGTSVVAFGSAGIQASAASAQAAAAAAMIAATAAT